jgi:hypothetical protein
MKRISNHHEAIQEKMRIGFMQTLGEEQDQIMVRKILTYRQDHLDLQIQQDRQDHLDLQTHLHHQEEDEMLWLSQ